MTEYSYSIKEIQSTMRFTAEKTNSEEQITNLIQSDTKTRLCQISHKSVLNKNYKVQKPEKTLKAFSMSKDKCDDKHLTVKKLDVPQLATKQRSKKENESKTSKENTKHNILDNILARLQVDHNMSDSQIDNNYSGNKTKFPKKGNIKNKKPPNLETSISPMESISLSPDQVEQGHYNLRKRKCKNYMEELDNNQGSEMNFDLQSIDSTITKQSMNWNDENTCDTDSSCEIIDIPKKKGNKIKMYQNEKQLKTVETENLYSKSKNSSRPLLKKKKTEFGKKVKRNFQEPLNSSDDSNVDTDESIYEVRDLNTHVVTNPIVNWNENGTLDKTNSDSSCDIFDFPKGSNKQLNKNQNRNQSKITETKASKSDRSKYPSPNKKKIKGLEKSGAFPSETKCRKSLNNGTTSFGSENGRLGKIDKSKNMFKKNNESKAISPYSNKIRQMDMKITTKNQHSYSGKEQAVHHDFLQEHTNLSSSLQVRSSSRQNLDKSHREDSYKKYLESIFKNSNQKTSTPQNALSTIQKQERRENALIEDSEENDELFSLSSTDSEDCEVSMKYNLLYQA